MQSKFSNFYVRSGVFAALSGIAAILNYALYPAISHFMDAASFGNFTALGALSNQILGILLAFNLTSIYIVKSFPEKEARENAQTVQKSLILIFLFAALLLILVTPLLSQKLKIQDTNSFLLVSLILLASIPTVIWTGYLQGHKKILHVGTFSLTAAAAKLLLSLLAASVLGVAGGLLGILLGTIVGLLVLKVSSPLHLPSITSIFSRFSTKQKAFLKSTRSYLIGSTLIVACFSILQNIDITYAKYLFSPDVAGKYAGISILSNAAYLGFFMLFWIILPEFDPKNNTHNRRLLSTSYKVLLVLGAIGVICALLCQKIIVHLLLGDNFTPLSNLLAWAITYQIMLVAVTLYVFYLLIIRSRLSLTLTLCIVPICLLAPLLANSPGQLVKILNLSLVFGFGVFQLVSLLLFSRKRHVKRVN